MDRHSDFFNPRPNPFHRSLERMDLARPSVRSRHLSFYGTITTQGKNKIIYIPKYCEQKYALVTDKRHVKIILTDLKSKKQHEANFIGSITRQGVNKIIYLPQYALEQLPDVELKKKYNIQIELDRIS